MMTSSRFGSKAFSKSAMIRAMKLLVCALEPSSNLHLKELIKHLQGVELIGIYEHSLGDPLYDVSEMAIMGVVDALRKLRWFLRVADDMVALAKEADKVLLMDGSGFNLPLAKKIKTAHPDKEILYYILPQIWASRPKRAAKLERYCDRLLGILPFESAYYSEGAVEYVGHPLLDEITQHWKGAKGMIAFMPGSRKAEISRLMPVFRSVRKRLSDKEAVVVIPPAFDETKIAALYGDLSGFRISRETHQTLAEAEFAYICSGTATLEAALIGTPFALAYRAKPLDYFIGTRLLGITQVGLANIMLTRHNGTTLHRELLQGNVSVAQLLEAYHQIDRAVFAQKATVIRDYLGHGSSKNVAHILMEDMTC
jgi:lipid-A-disaccharide synthase